MPTRPRLLVLLVALSLAACDVPPPGPAAMETEQPAASETARPATATPPTDAGAAAVPASATVPSAPFPAADAAEQVARLRRFVTRVDDLSEPDAAFFSDNLVSNETSFLHVADALSEVPRGAGYVGVGPEQNFSYIALLEPSVAYVVDIRRDNLRLHLLYKAAFEVARSRAHFVALLLGRPTPPDAPDAGGAREVLAGATSGAPTAESFAAAHHTLRERITGWGLRLGPTDLPRIEAIHRRFHDEQLDLRFALAEPNGRVYPTLGEMLAATDTAGAQRGFLATPRAWSQVARIQREHRIIPVVGDFAGRRALPGVAAALAEDGVKVGTFYVSNVEQYLLEPAVWARWRRNVAALPRAEGAVFVRAWLDQGRAHPLQRRGHRTATLLASIDTFESAQETRAHPSWWAIATEGATPAEGPPGSGR